MHDVNHASKLDYWASCLCPWGTIQVWWRRHLSTIKASFKCDKLLQCEERGTKTTLEQNININLSSVVENALLIQNWHSFLQGQISSGCSWFLSVVVWKGLRRNNFNCWPECFVKEVITSYHKLHDVFEVLKEAATVIVTTLTFLLYSLFKSRITPKEKL